MATQKINLYLLPGTMCDERLWQPVIDRLPPQYIAHYIDLPLGDTIEDIIRKLAQQLPSQPINLVGFSLGGYLATQFSLLYPSRVSRLMVLANSPSKLPLMEVKLRELALAMAHKFGYQGVMAPRINQLLAQQHSNDSELVSLIKAMDKSGGHLKFVSQVSSTTYRKNLIAQLLAQDIETYFVFGDQDKLVDQTALLALNANNISASVIKDCGHMSPLEQPQALVKHICQYFTY